MEMGISFDNVCDSYYHKKIAGVLQYCRKDSQYDVIHFDLQWCLMDAGSVDYVVDYINKGILNELLEKYASLIPSDVRTAYGAMSYINAATGNKFVIIIDEWDILIRDEAHNKEIQEKYINFLRGMFKGVEPTKYIALAYLTGILPIKKLKTQSALNNFEEFTMLDAGPLASYVGFTDAEVRNLCARYDKDYNEVKNWYDGYILSDYHIYNPKAVVSVMLRDNFKSYWSQTGTYESVLPLINKDFDGLKTAILAMLSGDEVRVKTTTFQNDMITFRNKDDVLTLLVHLGYLAFNQKKGTAYIPNEEIRREFMDAVEDDKWKELLQFELQSEELLEATWNMDSEKVAQSIERIHSEYASAIQYNNENSLSSVLTIAYLSSMNYYFKPIREFPTGKGFADFIFLPKSEYTGEYPALVVELKWNQDAETAVRQIKEKNYPQALMPYVGNILLVGISYDKKTKTHECMIEEYMK